MDTSRQGSNPGLRGERGEHSSKDLLQQLIRNLYHTTILPYGSQRLIIDETLKKHSEIFERLALRKKWSA
jgi:hypothetical protein